MGAAGSLSDGHLAGRLADGHLAGRLADGHLAGRLADGHLAGRLADRLGAHMVQLPGTSMHGLARHHPGRCTCSHCVAVLLSCCVAVLLSRCAAVLLSCCVAVLLCRCAAVLLPCCAAGSRKKGGPRTYHPASTSCCQPSPAQSTRSCCLCLPCCSVCSRPAAPPDRYTTPGNRLSWHSWPCGRRRCPRCCCRSSMRWSWRWRGSRSSGHWPASLQRMDPGN